MILLLLDNQYQGLILKEKNVKIILSWTIYTISISGQHAVKRTFRQDFIFSIKNFIFGFYAKGESRIQWNNGYFLNQKMGCEKLSCNVFSWVKQVQKPATRPWQSYFELRTKFFLHRMRENKTFRVEFFATV